MAKRIIKIDQLSNRAASMSGHKDAAVPQNGSMGLGDNLLNRFKFKKGMRE